MASSFKVDSSLAGHNGSGRGKAVAEGEPNSNRVYTHVFSTEERRTRSSTHRY